MSYLCKECDEVYEEPGTKFISGRVGHYDDWLPDEVINYCPNCGVDFEKSEEIDNE